MVQASLSTERERQKIESTITGIRCSSCEGTEEVFRCSGGLIKGNTQEHHIKRRCHEKLHKSRMSRRKTSHVITVTNIFCSTCRRHVKYHILQGITLVNKLSSTFGTSRKKISSYDVFLKETPLALVPPGSSKTRSC